MYAILTYKVQDFDTWRPLYDANEARRAAHGIKTLKIFREPSDHNSICMYWEVPSQEDVAKLFQDPEQKEIMQKAGVLGMPQATFYEEA